MRDPDGLAVSSRNAYLSAPERADGAGAVPAPSRPGRAGPGSGPEAVLAAARAVLDEAAAADPPLVPDYLALVDAGDVRAGRSRLPGTALLLVAARVGRTRLIDNATVGLWATVEEQPCC